MAAMKVFFHDPDNNMIEICNCNCLPVVPLAHLRTTTPAESAQVSDAIMSGGGSLSETPRWMLGSQDTFSSQQQVDTAAETSEVDAAAETSDAP
jgi:hypothetical protein